MLSLSPLSNGPLAVLVDGPVAENSAGEWSETDDDDMRWTFVGLLNHTLLSMYHPDLAFHPAKKIFYSPATRDLRPRIVKGRSSSSRGRAFFGPHFARDDVNKVSYYKHYAADLRFRCWEGQWYLEINPTYHYTIDGKRDSLCDSEYLAGMKRLERNKAVGELVRAWADFLKRTDQPSLFSPPDDRIVFGNLATVLIDAAIDENVWIVDREPEQGSPEARLFADDGVGT